MPSGEKEPTIQGNSISSSLRQESEPRESSLKLDDMTKRGEITGCRKASAGRSMRDFLSGALRRGRGAAVRTDAGAGAGGRNRGRYRLAQPADGPQPDGRP